MMDGQAQRGHGGLGTVSIPGTLFLLPISFLVGKRPPPTVPERISHKAECQYQLWFRAAWK